MKIKKLHLRNYKVFDDLNLDFTDSNGNTMSQIVLAGVNGCGKTTILEVIRQLYDGSIFRYLKSAFQTSISLSVELSEAEKIACELFQPLPKGLHDKIIFNPKNNTYETVLLSWRYDAEQKLTNDLQLFFNLIRSLTPDYLPHQRLIYLPVQVGASRRKTADLSLQIVQLDTKKADMKAFAIKKITSDLFEQQEKSVKTVLQNGIARINQLLDGIALSTRLVDLDSSELIFESANAQRIKFDDLSNGEQSLYFRAIYLSGLQPRDTMILVDEPEESLHPTWQQKILQLYQNIGQNNQVIVATHSPHIIGSVDADAVFLLEIEAHTIGVAHPRYTKGHTIDYILEVMGANPRQTQTIQLVDNYLSLVRRGEVETAAARQLKTAIDALALDAESQEMRRLNLSLQRFKVLGV